LTVVLSKPWRDHGVGTTLLIHPAARLWRPATREFIYRPRQHFARLSMHFQNYLRDNPQWDTDCSFVRGPHRHQ
jgi:hypothetical protein